MDEAVGLHWLHSHRIVHFDVKSQNILLARDGTCKIADVGLARSVQTAKGYLSEAGTLGTWAWSAPEVLTGQQCTVAADIYRWGRGGAGQGRAGQGWAGLQWGAVGGGQRSCSTCPTRFRARCDPPPPSPLSPFSPPASLGIVLWEIVTGEIPSRGTMRDPTVPEECPQVGSGRVGSCVCWLAGGVQRWWCPPLLLPRSGLGPSHSGRCCRKSWT